MTDKQKSIFVVILIVFFVFIAPVLYYLSAKFIYIIQTRKQYEFTMHLYHSTSSWHELEKEIRDKTDFSLFYWGQDIECISQNAPQYLNKPVYIISCTWADIPPFSYVDYLFMIPQIPIKYPKGCYFIVDKESNKVVDSIIWYND